MSLDCPAAKAAFSPEVNGPRAAPGDVRLLFYLPDLSGYRDRARLIDAVAARIGRAVLLVGRADLPEEEIGLRHARLVPVTQRGRLDRLALASSREARRLVAEEGINVLHTTFTGLLPLYWAWRRRRLPVRLASLYILSEWEVRHTFRPLYGWAGILADHALRRHLLKMGIHRFLAATAHRVVLQAPGLMARFAQTSRVPPERLTWLPNSVTAAPGRGASASPFGVPPVRLLYARAFSRMGGFDALLDLLTLARERCAPLEATAVGDYAPCDRVRLGRRLAELDLGHRLRLLPRVSPTELTALFDQSDWLYHPSRYDGSSRTVLEALAHGLPVLAAPHPGLEPLDPEGRYIALAEPHDTARQLNLALGCLDDSGAHRERSQAGTAHVAAFLTGERVAERYVDLYCRLLGEAEAG